MPIPANWTKISNNAPIEADLDKCITCLSHVTPSHGISKAELKGRLLKKDEITGLNNYMMETYLYNKNDGTNNYLAVFLERSLKRYPSLPDGTKGDPQRNHWCVSIGIDNRWDLTTYPPEEMYAQFKELLKYILTLNEENFGPDHLETTRQVYFVYPENAQLSRSLCDLMYLYMWFDPAVSRMEKVETAYARYEKDLRVIDSGNRIRRLHIQSIT